MNFTPKSIKHNKMFQEIVEQVEQAILQGELRPGDSLPPELQLKEMFQTGRSTVREAIRVLEALGYLEIRQGVGGGSFVKAIEPDNVANSMIRYLLSNNVSFDDIANFRELVEGGATALAAQSASSEQIEHLREILELSREVLEANPADWINHYKFDEKIHVAIAEITSNPLFVVVLHALHFNLLDADDRFAPKSPKDLWDNYESLNKIVTAIENGDAKAAERAAREHVNIFNIHMKEQAQKLDT